jgi:hypothetical protein
MIKVRVQVGTNLMEGYWAVPALIIPRTRTTRSSPTTTQIHRATKKADKENNCEKNNIDRNDNNRNENTT